MRGGRRFGVSVLGVKGVKGVIGVAMLRPPHLVHFGISPVFKPEVGLDPSILLPRPLRRGWYL